MVKKDKSTKEFWIDKLRLTLAKQQFQGRILQLREIYRDMNTTKVTFNRHIDRMTLAQEFLDANPQAPIPVRQHYAAIIKEFSKETNVPDVRVGKRVFTVEKTHVVETVKKIMAPGNQTVAEVISKKPVTEIVVVTEEDKTIDRIKQEYIFATPTEMPSINKIMRDFGLIDKDDKPTGKVTEEMVRERMTKEDWRGERREFLFEMQDLLPEEIAMFRQFTSIEREKQMHDEFKILLRMNRQYWQDGRVMSLNKNKELEYMPSMGELLALTEAIKRTRDDGPSVAIQINNNFSKGGKAAPEARGSISPAAKAMMTKILGMTPEKIAEETKKLDAMIQMLEAPREQVDIKSIEAQDAVDAVNNASKSTEENEEK